MRQIIDYDLLQQEDLQKAQDILSIQKNFFKSGKTLSYEFRIEQLDKLANAIKQYTDELLEAVFKDLHKSAFEGYATEIGGILQEIVFVKKNLKAWMKDEKVSVPVHLSPAKAYIHSEPYGSCLIIAPWNYPISLQIFPLIGAIAAGNCSVLKPSEYSINTSRVLYQMIAETFDEEYICLLQGDKEISTILINQPFDQIFFTGSSNVGKVILQAAANNLTPVVLELGGKSPCIVCKDADLDKAAKRIVHGKFMNAGQTCVAPDYLFVDKNIKDVFLDKVVKYIKEFYGEDASISKDYGRIINKQQVDRLIGLLRSGEVIYGGKYNVEDFYIEPTIIDNVSWDDAIMQEEIFGPLLPIFAFDTLEEVIEKITSKPKPLALYVFSESKKMQNLFIEQVSFGGGCINDTVLHVACNTLPFGGVGNSGMGSYHGKYSFATFSHQKSILKKSTLFQTPFLYPPYSEKFTKMFRKFF